MDEKPLATFKIEDPEVENVKNSAKSILNSTPAAVSAHVRDSLIEDVARADGGPGQD